MGETVKALITGITGMDGSHLADLLLSKNYEVHGIIRRSSSFNTARIDHIFHQLHLHYGDLTDSGSLNKILKEVQPDEIYNLGAQSHVKVSFECPEYTCDVDALGTLRLLEAIHFTCPQAKFYQASSSEMYGKVLENPQTETTPFYPRSPYGIAKVFSYWACRNYRERGMFACNGILFNHTSDRRGETFVSRKIVKGLVRIYRGQQNKLLLGNLEARRDWGWAPEFVSAIWLMMQHPTPEDFVVATGKTHSVREFLDEASYYLNMMDWRKYVEIDSRYFRPTEVDYLCGDASKAKRLLGWTPKVGFQEIVQNMIEEELKIR